MQVALSPLVTSGQVAPDAFYYILCNTSTQEREAVLHELTGSKHEELSARIKQLQESLEKQTIHIGRYLVEVRPRFANSTFLGYSSMNEWIAKEVPEFTPDLANEFMLAVAKSEVNGNLDLDGVLGCCIKVAERRQHSGE